MTTEPDIVSVLRQEEKDGKLRSDFTIGTENQIQFDNFDIDPSKTDNKTFSDLLEIINSHHPIITRPENWESKLTQIARLMISPVLRD